MDQKHKRGKISFKSFLPSIEHMMQKSQFRLKKRSTVAEIKKIQQTIENLIPRIEGPSRRKTIKSLTPSQLPISEPPSFSTYSSNRRNLSLRHMHQMGHCFAHQSRFPDGQTSPLQAIIRTRRSISLEHRKGINMRILRHKKSLDDYSFSAQKDQQAEKARERRQSQQILAMNKKYLDDRVKNRRREKLEHKFKKLKIRIFTTEYSNLSRGLTRLALAMGMCTVFVMALHSGQNYSRHIRSLQQRLMYVARFLGKMRQRVIRHRQRLATQTLTILFHPIVKLRLRCRRLKYRKMVKTIFNYFLSQKGLHNIVAKWYSKLGRIIELAQNSKLIRNARIRALIVIWDQFNIKVSGLTLEDKSRLSIPSEVKVYYIRKYIQSRLRVYIKQYRPYLHHQHRLKTSWEYRYDYNRAKLIHTHTVFEKPSLRLFSQKALLKKLVVKADLNRINWVRIIETERRLNSELCGYLDNSYLRQTSLRMKAQVREKEDLRV